MFQILILFYLVFISPILCIPLCYNTSPLPPNTNIKIDSNFTIDPVYFNNKPLTTFQIADRIFTKNQQSIYGYTSYYNNSKHCPPDFIIPRKEHYEEIISKLGKKAYEVFTDPNGFNMTQGYYLATTKGTAVEWFAFYLMYLDGKSIKFADMDASRTIILRCMLKVPDIKISSPGVETDYNLKTQYLFKSNGKYFNGYLWRIDDTIFHTQNFTYTFNNSGNHRIQLWASLINGETLYACTYAYVRKKSVSKEQTFSENNIKLIETNFSMDYSGFTTFEHANAPVAPKINGEYLVAVTDMMKFIHILHFDRNDKLIRDLNTSQMGYPHDIVETDYGFVLYAMHDDYFRSYLSLYNKNFELINTVKIMDNDPKGDRTIQSDPSKQVMKYDNNGRPAFGMIHMGNPDTGKVAYTKGRVYLIFGHINYYPDKDWHNGDSTITLNDILKDIDFGNTWGASHTLIQSVTYDDNYFISAALMDPGLLVVYVSKTEFDLDWNHYYDSVAKRYNVRKMLGTSQLVGKMTGTHTGTADARLGGILYFEKLKLYCLVYSKNPNYSNDEKNNTNIIYMTTWNLVNNVIKNNITREIRVFPSGLNDANVRCGKLGDDKVFIMYNESTGIRGINYRIFPGSVPKVSVIQLEPYKFLVRDKAYDKLYMNSNEDLKTFHDGVLIWATANKNQSLVINKIGTPRLDDSFDDIDYILSKEDLKDEFSVEDSKVKWYVILLIILGVVILAFGAFILYKFVIKKRSQNSPNLNDVKGKLIN